jgi:hypothetical protein
MGFRLMARQNGDGWIELYRAALLESNKDVLPERVALAERAIQAFVGELESSDTAPKAQLQNLCEALRALDALRRLYS